MDTDTNIDDRCFSDQFQDEPADSSVDFVSHDGSTILEVQAKPQGIRGMYTGLMQLALGLSQRPESHLGVLVIDSSRISKERLTSEWEQLRTLFTRKIARRLAIICIRDGEHWSQPDNPSLNHLAAGVLANKELGFTQSSGLRKLERTSKKAEIYKVLLGRWLLSKGPIGIGELGEHVGCSYPTVRKSLDSISSLESGLRQGDATHFPARVWTDIMALTSGKRHSIRFIDRSGQRPDLDSLIRRLDSKKPKNVAFGGVVAARHWDSKFDLNGTPRIDLHVHCANDLLDLGFIRKLDPALKEDKAEEFTDSPTVVVHAITRTESDFENHRSGGLPIVDPVETAIDLIDLGLTQQANNLFARLRKEVPIA